MTLPIDREAALQEAAAFRAHNRLPEALMTLARLEIEHPHFSRLHQERGHCHILLRDLPAAIAALREAVRLNPTLPSSWTCWSNCTAWRATPHRRRLPRAAWRR